MIKSIKNNSLSKLLLFLFLNLIFTGIIFLSFQDGKDKLGICDEYEKIEILINKNITEFLYPFNNCDDVYYFKSVEDFNSLFSSEANPYQNRPVYILSINVLNRILNFGNIVLEKNPIPLLPFITFQILLLSISQFSIFKIIEKFKKIEILDIFLISISTFIYPLYKFGIFKTSHQTFALLIFSISIYMLVAHKVFNYEIFLLLGILYLVNRSFIICLFILTLLEIKNKKFSINYLVKYFFKVVSFFVPALFYRFYIFFNNFDTYDINSEKYGQFIWLENYIVRYGNAVSIRIFDKPLFNYRNFESEWHCVSIPENFLCFFNDSFEMLKYLSGGLLIIILFIKFSKIPRPLFKSLLQITLLSYLFWSFIGWYPPIRFNLYSLGMGILLFAVFQVVFLKSKKLKYLYAFLWTINFYLLEHWNVFGNY